MADIILAGSTSGSITVSSPAVSGSNTLTLPAATDTLVGKATTDTLTNKSIVASQLTGTVAAARLPAGSVIQVVNYQTGAVATGTTLLPFDDTIPQNTEGFEVMTLAITPTSATNLLRIQSIAHVAVPASGAYKVGGALFQDTTANALAASANWTDSTGTIQSEQIIVHKMTSGTTSATTFKVRVGCNVAATVTFNGQGGSRLFGGVIASSITITEIAV